MYTYRLRTVVGTLIVLSLLVMGSIPMSLMAEEGKKEGVYSCPELQSGNSVVTQVFVSDTALSLKTGDIFGFPISYRNTNDFAIENLDVHIYVYERYTGKENEPEYSLSAVVPVKLGEILSPKEEGTIPFTWMIPQTLGVGEYVAFPVFSSEGRVYWNGVHPRNPESPHAVSFSVSETPKGALTIDRSVRIGDETYMVDVQKPHTLTLQENLEETKQVMVTVRNGMKDEVALGTVTWELYSGKDTIHSALRASSTVALKFVPNSSGSFTFDLPFVKDAHDVTLVVKVLSGPLSRELHIPFSQGIDSSVVFPGFPITSYGRLTDGTFYTCVSDSGLAGGENTISLSLTDPRNGNVVAQKEYTVSANARGGGYPAFALPLSPELGLNGWTFTSVIGSQEGPYDMMTVATPCNPEQGLCTVPEESPILPSVPASYNPWYFVGGGIILVLVVGGVLIMLKKKKRTIPYNLVAPDVTKE